MAQRSYLLTALFSGSGHTHLERMLTQGIGVEHADGLLRFALRAHRYESKPPGLAASPFLDDFSHGDVSGLCKQSIQFLIGCSLGQIPYM